MATKLPRELVSVILLWTLIISTFDNNVLGQRTQYDIDREESLRRQRPSVSNILVFETELYVILMFIKINVF